ncbi:hypothetical protein MtrunA17_Chr6g0464811 [Medicago truncatula]|uniref:Uncharacterized protein n=1 Tax=Medicago truncatula TaxID=3880 RepID=A0A396HIN8_MEDTR|nr:hypothetical protein MtrunA17_Chr6g0464811 [Medicago truncatula]
MFFTPKIPWNFLQMYNKKEHDQEDLGTKHGKARSEHENSRSRSVISEGDGPQIN